ncbi:MAG: hypothetical protein Q9Q40_13140 [Acidobacteriota bacterium]|nr:hypothetical protein [Acidobacteriota bacterium]MDQ7088634.1 hypothetical protein [Acidobacteriota bacterium]
MTVPPSPSTVTATRLRRFAWVGVFALASGIPFGVFKDLVPVWLRSEGVPVEAIGALGALAMPWSLKVLWAPLVDRVGGRRTWIAGSLALAAAALGAMALVPPEAATVLACFLGGFTVVAATADVAIDAYAIGILEKGEEGYANALRVAGWRGGVLLAGGLLVVFASRWGWPVAIALGAGTLFALGLAAPLAPRLEIDRSGAREPLFRGLARWAARPGAASLAALVLFYKWPDAALGPMVRTFWVDGGLSLSQIGALAVPVTIVATIGGAWVGGWFVARWGLLAGLFWLGLAQACSNLAYAGADLAGGGRDVVLAAATVENFCGGLGTAAFFALLMRVCEKERAAVEYALLSALFASTRDLTGAVSGFGVAAFGYAGWFAATAFLALPGLALVFSRALARRVDEPPLWGRSDR